MFRWIHGCCVFKENKPKENGKRRKLLFAGNWPPAEVGKSGEKGLVTKLLFKSKTKAEGLRQPCRYRGVGSGWRRGVAFPLPASN